MGGGAAGGTDLFLAQLVGTLEVKGFGGVGLDPLLQLRAKHDDPAGGGQRGIAGAGLAVGPPRPPPHCLRRGLLTGEAKRGGEAQRFCHSPPVAASANCSPVIGTVGLAHGGVHGVGDEPLKALLGAQADGAPVPLAHVAAGGVEVAKEHHILPAGGGAQAMGGGVSWGCVWQSPAGAWGLQE